MSLRQHQAGFTLLELLVVLIIVGVMYSMLVLSTGTASSQRALEEEVYRLQALIKLLHEEAIIQSREMALEIDRNSYRFLVLDEKAWKPIVGDMVFRQRALPEPLRIELLESDDSVNKQITGKEDEPLRVYILSSGEQSPFELELRAGESHQFSYRLSGKWNGELLVKLLEQGS